MFDELDPEKYHVLSQKKKRLIAISIIVFLLLAVPPVLYIYYNFAINRPSQTADEITMKIEKGEGVYQIATRLYENDVINSKYLFTLYVLATNKDKNIQAGVYMFPPGMSMIELADVLQYGTNDQKITFLEGWRVEEYARAAAEMYEDVAYESFVSAAHSSEGFLFPDTYEFRYDVTEKDIISDLKDNFKNKVRDLLTYEALESLGLTESEVVILASIVEREVKEESDRAVVAGILVKRLNQEITLGADATTQYAAAFLRAGCDVGYQRICPSDDAAVDMDWWPHDLVQAEIDYENPYNTRKVVGLPPAPICNPGYVAVKAVVQYVPTQYNYYLTDRDGITHYAVTLDEHLSNVYIHLR